MFRLVPMCWGVVIDICFVHFVLHFLGGYRIISQSSHPFNISIAKVLGGDVENTMTSLDMHPLLSR